MRTTGLSEAHGAASDKSDSFSIYSKRLSAVNASSLFTGLSYRDCAKVASCATTRTFFCDEFLFTQGQPARDFVMVQTGSVKLSQLSTNGNEAIIWMAGPGESVGHPADCTSRTHGCSARATERCEALFWEFRRLQYLLEEFPQISLNISQVLFNRLAELQERFREVATESVATRLALALVRLVKQVGKPTHGGIEVIMSREEFAQMTGAVECTVSRHLSRWEREGLVLSRRKSVVVLDVLRLAQRAALLGKEESPPFLSTTCRDFEA